MENADLFTQSDPSLRQHVVDDIEVEMTFFCDAQSVIASAARNDFVVRTSRHVTDEFTSIVVIFDVQDAL